MKGEQTLFLIAFALGSLKLVDYYKQILDTKDVSDVSITYTILGLVSSIIWLFFSVKTGANIVAAGTSLIIALEMYILYILLEREIKLGQLKPKKADGEANEDLQTPI
jgi:uncharacterized protein with PQ loop repeat